MNNVTYSRVRLHANDDLYTPESAIVDELAVWLDQFSHVWEPCAGKGHLSDILERRGLRVTSTDICDGLEYDIRHIATMPSGVEAIVTNPPYSIKRDVIACLSSLNVPFAVLLPVNTMCNKWYKPYAGALRIIPIYGRLRFVDQVHQAPFYSAWFVRDL